MDRMPTVAGQFYPGDPFRIKSLVTQLLALPADAPAPDRPAILSMAPHAGYIFSGPTAARTLARAGLSGTVILLGPNHTGLGQRLAVWEAGLWHFPGAAVAVDSALAQALTCAEPRLTADRAAHIKEHSLEVMLPFLHYLDPDLKIVPICVAVPVLSTLTEVAARMADVIKAWPGQISIVVSSDMSHYISAAQAKKKDNLALERILALDPEGLFRVVRQENISMCGIMPMTLGLTLAKQLGASRAELVDYTNSGQVTGESSQVVAYAGVLAW